jgi:hypothetical protein
MQLVPFSDRIKPLTLAAALLSATPAFAYTDLNAYSDILTSTSNLTTLEYIKSVDKNGNNMLLRELKFRNHLINWKSNTKYMSSVQAIIENEDFRAIVAMGNSGVPYIINEIESNPSTLVWALNLILGHKITESPNATISEACKLWVKKLKK